MKSVTFHSGTCVKMGCMWIAPLTPAPSPHALTWESAWEWFQGGPLTVAAIVVGAALVRFLVHRFIDGMVAGLVARTARTARAERRPTSDTVDRTPTSELPVLRRKARLIGRNWAQTWQEVTPSQSLERQEQRVRTLGAVLRSIATVVIVLTAILMIGDQLGINITPILASASVGGVALAFGAQSLVKDFLSGMFMIFEDQYGVGDVIDTGDVIGTVEDVSLRVTKIRDFNGVLWYIRNGEILRVANRSQGWSMSIVDIPVSVSENMHRVLAIISGAIKNMDADPEWHDQLLEEPEVGGIESITAGVATVRITAKCAPNESGPVAREIRERVMAALSKEGIRLAQLPLTGLTQTQVLPKVTSS